jgi:nucleotide-binding universal stress UspA family protein
MSLEGFHDTLEPTAHDTELHPEAMRILVAYDGSAHAQAAIKLAEDLFKPCVLGQKCSLTAMTVLPTQYIGGHETLQQSLDEVKQHLELQDMPVQALIKAGNPAASINAYAEEFNADLIVIGAQGLRATLGILLGGVAQQVVEYSHCPVLVVRAPYNGIKRVLLATDGSTFGQRAVEYLAPICPGVHKIEQPRFHEKAKPTSQHEEVHRRCSWLPPDARVTLMHVLPPPISPELAARAWSLGPEVLYPAPAAPLDVASIEADEQRQGERVLNQAQSVFEAAGLAVDTQLLRGDAATEIIHFAHQHAIDLIVCGSRGLSQVTSWLLGSVSRKLVHYANSSVLIVKSPGS